MLSTKNRRPFLVDPIRPRVHAYLATTVRDLGSPWVVVGGVADHVHLLFDLGRGRPPVEYVERAKRESSKFVKTLGDEYRDFYWQRGYGLFSVGPADRDVAEAYVRNQPQHHRTRTFQDEFRGLLGRYDVAFDGRYVWD